MAISSSNKEYRDGEMVACQHCGKKAQIKWFANKQSALVPPGEREKLALRCQSCGFITCNVCAHVGDSMFPVCPNCQKEWGPYYFIGGPAALKTMQDIFGEDTPPGNSIQTGSWEQALRMDLPKMGDLDEEKGPNKDKRAGRMSGSPVILLVFLLIGVFAAGLVFVLLRLPAITHVFAGLMPQATPTSFSLITTDAVATPTLMHDQPIAIEGAITSPTNEADCKMSEDGFRWCRVSIQTQAMLVAVWVKLGNPMDSLTSSMQFLDHDGALFPSGSTVRIDGIVNCQAQNDCLIRVQKIEVITQATITPTPTIAKSATPTLVPSATPIVTETPVFTATPTDSGCVDALNVTLDNLDEELCVQGIVSEVFVQEQAVLLLFDKQANSFMFVSYEPPLDFVKVGMCVVGFGKIQRLGNRPVIVVSYKYLVKQCP